MDSLVDIGQLRKPAGDNPAEGSLAEDSPAEDNPVVGNPVAGTAPEDSPAGGNLAADIAEDNPAGDTDLARLTYSLAGDSLVDQAAYLVGHLTWS